MKNYSPINWICGSQRKCMTDWDWVADWWNPADSEWMMSRWAYKLADWMWLTLRDWLTDWMNLGWKGLNDWLTLYDWWASGLEANRLASWLINLDKLWLTLIECLTRLIKPDWSTVRFWMDWLSNCTEQVWLLGLTSWLQVSLTEFDWLTDSDRALHCLSSEPINSDNWLIDCDWLSDWHDVWVTKSNRSRQSRGM